VVARLPAQYRAETTIKVIDARPPSDYVHPSFATPAVSDIVGERMKALRLHILNRPLLVEVARELGLASDDDGKAIERLREQFDFRVEGADTFTVSYADRDAGRAAAVINLLAKRFMEQENREIEGRAQGTTKLLGDSATDLRKQLDAADLKIADFKRQHYGALPEQQEELLRGLDQTQMEINILETTLQSASDRRRRLLEGDISPLRRAEDELSQKLSAARTQYTNGHPEVQKLAIEYDHVRNARIEDEQRLRQQTLTQNPEVLAVSSEIARLRSHQTELRGKQSSLRGRVGEVAKNQQALAALSLDRDVIKDKYQSLQGKLREAEVSERLARDFRPFRFAALEPAVRPIQAASPNRPLLAAGALALALLLAFGTGLGLELADPTVRDATDVAQVTPELPVLAAIPRIEAGHPSHRAPWHSAGPSQPLRRPS
jgi:uncharacterized protein involved in exopolysaccharide biosynthesis